jgi:hypothetical protein
VVKVIIYYSRPAFHVGGRGLIPRKQEWLEMEDYIFHLTSIAQLVERRTVVGWLTDILRSLVRLRLEGISLAQFRHGQHTKTETR